MVGNAVLSETALRVFLIFCMKLEDYKDRKVTEPNFEKSSWFGDIHKKVSKWAQNQTLWYFFSKTALTIYLVFGLKLVLKMAFNFNETYFSEKFAIWRYLTSKSSKIRVFGHFFDFASLVVLDFVHNDMWAWCLVVFLQFAGPVNIFLFL